MSDGEVRMTLVGHLDELRTRILRSMLALIIGAGVAACFTDSLVAWATLPHFRAMMMLGEEGREELLALDYMQAMMAVVKLALITGVFLAAPVIFHQAWAFVRPGLHVYERRWVVPFTRISYLLFLLGCTTGYFLVIPYVFYGMGRFLPREQVSLVFSFSDYLSLFMTFTIFAGAIFQVPLVMCFLSVAGVVEPEAFARRRRHAIVAGFIAAAIVAPGDPGSLVALAAPIILLYEAGIWVARLVVRGSRRARPPLRP